MSLKLADWKKELEQPKNVGLRVFGTGVSKLLEEYEKAEKALSTNPTIATSGALAKTLVALKAKCDELSKKHSKVFTSASAHLAKTSKAAAARFEILEFRTNLLAQKKAFKEEPPASGKYPGLARQTKPELRGDEWY